MLGGNIHLCCDLNVLCSLICFSVKDGINFSVVISSLVVSCSSFFVSLIRRIVESEFFISVISNSDYL